MKYFVFSSLITGMFLFLSCSSDDVSQTSTAVADNVSVVDANDEAEFAKIAAELNVLGQAYSESHETRINWGRLFRWVGVGLSDLVGAALGSTVASSAVVGAGCSAAAHHYLFKKRANLMIEVFYDPTVSYSRTRSNLLNLFPDSTYSGVDGNIGYYHNLMICRVFSDSTKLASYCAGDSLQKLQLLIDEYEDITSSSIGFSASEKGFMASQTYNMGLIYDNSDSEEDFFTQVKSSSSGVRITSSEADAIASYFTSLSHAGLNRPTFMNQALRVVDKSNLSAPKKIMMENSMIVGNASLSLIFDLGINEYEYEDEE